MPDRGSINIEGRLYLSLNVMRSSQKIPAQQNSPTDVWRESVVICMSQQFMPICMTLFVEELDPSNEHLPISLEHIHQFYETIEGMMQSKPQSNVLLCTGPSPYTQFGTLFLIGCYSILSGLDLRETAKSLMDFEYVISTVKCHGHSAQDFWRCLDQIKQMGWINFEAVGELKLNSLIIDIEEFVHYARL